MSKKTLEIQLSQASSRGRKTINQDFYAALIPSERKLMSKGAVFAIADGISSSAVSHIASETAVRTFIDDYYLTPETWSVKKSSLQVLSAINAWLYAQTRNGPHRYDREKGYICTFSAVIIKSQTAHIFHTGDSRIYRISGGDIEQLTHDQRGFGESGESYLTRAMGMTATLDMEYQSLSVREGESFMLATDGLFEYVAQEQVIEAVSAAEGDFESQAQQLTESALNNGSDDNITLQLFRIDRLPSPSLEELQGDVQQLPFPPPLSARAKIDGFEILRELYISPRSHVYLALDIEAKQRVVLKTPSGESRNDAAYLESFLMEEWVAKRLNNPFILKVYEADRSRHFLYSVTEYVDGQTLSQWMRDNPSPSIETVRSIVEQIARGLQAFHRQEMVHQDLRPNNVMLDKHGVVKIIDFGATKVAGISEIKPFNEGIVGTMQFTAPEYFLGQSGTSRSDIFSLGVIAYQMISGRLPYGTAVCKATNASAQRRLRYASLCDENKSIPDWVDYAIAKAVHINPNQRYAELSEFLHDLRQPSRQYTTMARPPLIESNPVMVWQMISALLLSIIIYQNFI